MKNIVILGGSGIGMIAASIIGRKEGYNVLGFLNDVVEKGTHIGKYKKIEVIGNSDDLFTYLQEDDTSVFIAYVGLQNEKDTYKKIESLNIPSHKFINIIDETA